MEQSLSNWVKALNEYVIISVASIARSSVTVEENAKRAFYPRNILHDKNHRTVKSTLLQRKRQNDDFQRFVILH